MVHNEKEVAKIISIGMCFDSFIIERWQRDRDAFVAKATKELGATVNIQNANGDVDEQVKQIDYFIDKKVDVLVIVAIDSEAVTEAVKRAKKANIKVIAYDRLIRNANVDLYITFDNEKVGTFMAQTIKDNIPDDGKILMMCGPLEDNNVPLVQEGFSNTLKDTNIQVMATEHATGWIAETGFDFVSDYLSNNENVDAIMCGNDGIASQVIHALSERRMAGEVCVVGQDADLDACQRIVEGTQTMTVYKPVEKLAQKAAEYAVALGKGEYMAAPNTFYDGAQEVPYEGLEPIAVTKENMDIIINDGFHLEEDIYLNVKKEQ
jgi:D-xylose transport system substrate-binding protein